MYTFFTPGGKGNPKAGVRILLVQSLGEGNTNSKPNRDEDSPPRYGVNQAGVNILPFPEHCFTILPLHLYDADGREQQGNRMYPSDRLKTSPVPCVGKCGIFRKLPPGPIAFF